MGMVMLWCTRTNVHCTCMVPGPYAHKLLMVPRVYESRARGEESIGQGITTMPTVGKVT